MQVQPPAQRAHTDSRTISIALEDLDRVDGSARFGFGDVKALASVSGPIEVKIAAEQASRATLEVNVRPLRGTPATESRSLASSLKSILSTSLILTHNPRTLIQVVVQALSPPSPFFHGSSSAGTSHTTLDSTALNARTPPALVAALINAATLSLLRASSVPMKGIAVAVAVGKSASGDLVVDPDETDPAFSSIKKTESDMDVDAGPSASPRRTAGTGCFAFLFSPDGQAAQGAGEVKEGTPKAVWSTWSGAPLSEEELTRVWELARGTAQQVVKKMREALSTTSSGLGSKPASVTRTKVVGSISKDAGAGLGGRGIVDEEDEEDVEMDN